MKGTGLEFSITNPKGPEKNGDGSVTRTHNLVFWKLPLSWFYGDLRRLKMSWRFRKTFKVFPGVKLNLTHRGLSTTLGTAPFSMNVGPRGVYRNVSIPGTGIWDRQRIDTPSKSGLSNQRHAAGDHVLPPPLIPSVLPAVTEIRSASTEMLKSRSMADLQQLLEEAFEERSILRGITLSIVGDLKGLTEEIHRAVEDLKGGSRTFRVNIEFTSPPQLATFTAEMEEVNRHPEWISG
jgi:hypothetical protein